MTDVDFKQTIDNLILSKCPIPGHQLKEVAFVCLDSSC